jgi:hypothetical protein
MIRALFCTGLALGLAACTGSGDLTPDEIDDEIYGPPLVDGQITVEWRESLPTQTGKIKIRKAFGIASANKGAVYMSSNGEATCDDVVEALKKGGTYDQSKIFKAGYCNISLGFKYEALDGTSHTDDPINALWSIQCPFGDTDTWEYGKNGNGDKGYWFTGYMWQGDPIASTVSFAGEERKPFDVSVDITGYTGSFIYDDFGEFQGTGSSMGDFTVEMCDQLTQTPIWPL